MSPVVVRCSECGYVLHENKGANFGTATSFVGYMETIIKRHEGKYPKCGHRLTLPPKTVEVKPFIRFGENAGSSRSNHLQGGYADFNVGQRRISGSRTMGRGVLPPPAL